VAASYRLTALRGAVNALVSPLTRVGLAGRHTYVLTVPGRRSGRLYSTPVALLERDGERWLVSPYGEVSWVRNVRAHREVTLARRGRSETLRAEEVDAATAAPVLRDYMRWARVTRPFFDAAADAPVAAFEPRRHGTRSSGSVSRPDRRAAAGRGRAGS
jgi:deazaflavin-dependent oxidoreductase (nitroreductase family)